MRALLATLATIVGLSLVGCQDPQSPAPTAGGKPIVVSQAVWASFQKYLRDSNNIAFAVSEDGNGSFYYYCDSQNCPDSQARIDAVSVCARTNHQQCRLFAIRSRIVVPYEVAPY